MTAPVPPGRVQAPPLTAAEAEIVARFDAAPDLDLAAEARQEAVARALHGADTGTHGGIAWDDPDFTEWERDVYRRLAAAAIAADDARRAGQAGGAREALLSWLLTFTGRDHEPSEADRTWLANEVEDLLRGPLAALAPADHEPAAAIQRVLDLADRSDSGEWTCARGFAESEHWQDGRYSCPASRIQRESVEDALENDRCGICGSVEHFREDCPAVSPGGQSTGQCEGLREDDARPVTTSKAASKAEDGLREAIGQVAYEAANAACREWEEFAGGDGQAIAIRRPDGLTLDWDEVVLSELISDRVESALLAGPLAPLLAAQEAVERVREIADELTSGIAGTPGPGVIGHRIRRALDPS
jgi:hypothetical protein